MGLAIIAIVLFHVALPRTDAFFGLKRMGNVGVDVFFFLSGMGLWFSWVKQPSLGHFYRRRLLRILPAWLLVATAFYLPDYLGPQKFSSSVVDLLGDITINWDFWAHDELTFWYIPATLVLYLFAPWYMRLLEKAPACRWLPVAMIMWCVAVQYVQPIHAALGHIEIFWSRVPIFFIGISLGETIRSRAEMEHSALGMILFTFVAAFALCVCLEQTMHGRFPLFLERLLYIPLTVSMLLLCGRWFDHSPRWLSASLTFVGTISLEIYLIHCHFILVYIQRMHWGYWPTALTCLLATLPIAWALHKVIDILIKAIQRR